MQASSLKIAVKRVINDKVTLLLIILFLSIIIIILITSFIPQAIKVISILGTIFGVILGRYLDTLFKPEFKFLKVTGNEIEGLKIRVKEVDPQESEYIPCDEKQKYKCIQCSMRYEVEYIPFGSRALAKNSRGWVKLDDKHGAMAPWGYTYKYSLDIVGEESLVVLFIRLKTDSSGQGTSDKSSLEDVNKLLGNIDKICFTVPPGESSEAWNRILNPCFKFDDIRDLELDVRVAAENVNGSVNRWKLKKFVEECLQNYKPS
ncbi:hypothetical protein GFS03_03965 [Sulfolobus sp. E5-1-F]|uniref:hypothetical protein n=1 Tax=Saccharolobus sp. E5-1-F TaxID=2663019 RepID=UPI0012974F64|nr:hypothetical protein [Sulfolobus sp. E5-1-F]QGA53800.1 hypothetical protein GFS03_03965 [Sulfolobus sp. E5-1-F]